MVDEHSKKLLGMDEYTRELSRICRELLPAGANRDYDRMLELANAIENLVIDSRERDGNPIDNPG